jgi:hypothetical protein
VLRHGVPLASFPLGFVCEGETSRHFAITDAAGHAKASIDRAGRWLVHGTHLRPSTVPGLEWISDFATLVIETAPAR